MSAAQVDPMYGPNWHTYRAAGTQPGVDLLQLTRLSRFYDEVLRAHTVHQQNGGAPAVCQCGVIPSLCPVHRARIRHGLVHPDSMPWADTVLPEDRATATDWWQQPAPPHR